MLARLARVGPALYEARIIRVLDRQQKRLFGVVVPAGKGFRLQPADRGKRDSLVLTTHDKITLKAGDLVEAELLPVPSPSKSPSGWSRNHSTSEDDATRIRSVCHWVA